MKFTLVFVSFGTMILLIGCNATSAKNASQPDRVVTVPKGLVISEPAFGSQRFIPTSSADLAFDTKTGSLCKTGAWVSEEEQNPGRDFNRRMDTCNQLYAYDVQEETRQRYEAWQHEAQGAKP